MRGENAGMSWRQKKKNAEIILSFEQVDLIGGLGQKSRWTILGLRHTRKLSD